MHKSGMKNTWKICKYFIFRCAGFPFELIEKIRFKDTYQIIGRVLEKKGANPCIQEAKEIFEEELYRKRLQLQEIVSTEKFQEAVFHQNQNNCQGYAYETIINFSKQKIDPDARNYKSRQQEFLAYRYLQRFCTKNETVSFFGPFYIDGFVNSNRNIVFKKNGANKIKNRKAYISTWLLKSILDKIIHDKEVFKMLKPQMVPVLCLDGKQAVHLVTGKRIKLDGVCLKILGLIAQKCSIKEVSLRLKKDKITEKQVFTKVIWLIKNNLLLSGLEVAASVDEPQKHLINKLSGIAAVIKNEWYLKLVKLSKLKSEFEDGNFEDRKKAIVELRRMFRSLLSNSRFKNTRFEKGFFTEYCEADIKELKLGRDIYRSLEGNLSLILNLASYNKANLIKINRLLLGSWLKVNFSGKEIGVKDIICQGGKNLGWANSPFKIGSKDFLGASVDDLPADFLDFINQDKKSRQVNFKRIDLEKKFRKILDKAEGPAGTCCDISIEASGGEDINKEDYNIVFGESHKLRRALSVFRWMVEFSSNGGKLIREIKDIHKNIGKYYTLGDFLIIPHDILSNAYDFSTISQIGYSIPSERKKNKIDYLSLKIRRDSNSVSLIEAGKKKPVLFLVSPVSLCNLFSILSPEISNLRHSETKTHFPRVKIDKFIFQRESWIFVKKDLFFAQESYERKGWELWKELEGWRRKEGIPKQFFLNIKTGAKPFFIDFENYFAVEVFMNFVKKAKDKLSITEMLPGQERLWYKDSEGRYTSEFRLIVYKG